MQCHCLSYTTYQPAALKDFPPLPLIQPLFALCTDQWCGTFSDLTTQFTNTAEKWLFPSQACLPALWAGAQRQGEQGDKPDRLHFHLLLLGNAKCSSGEVPVAMPVSTLSIFHRLSSNREEEAKILDYQTQQEKLLPQLAAAYAFHFINNYLHELFDRGYREIQGRNFDLLPEVSRHGISSHSYSARNAPLPISNSQCNLANWTGTTFTTR